MSGLFLFRVTLRREVQITSYGSESVNGGVYAFQYRPPAGLLCDRPQII